MFETRKTYRISLPEPCHEKWHEMTATEKGRFCANCQKEVIDFTQLNDAKIIDFLKTSQKGFCGRFRETQLERKIEKQRDGFGLSYLKKAIATFLAIISLKKGFAQQEVSFNAQCDSSVESNVKKVKIDTLITKQKIDSFISGFVIDADKHPLHNALITIHPYGVLANTDANGFFKLNLINHALDKNSNVSISYPDKVSLSIPVFESSFPNGMTFTLIEKMGIINVTTGFVFVTGGYKIPKSKKKSRKK